MKELRNGISNSLGIDKYLNALWEKEYPAEKQEELIKRERPKLEKEYVRVSHIFFNTFQNPEMENSPDKVRKETKARAMAGWKRLQKGDSFEAVVKAVSEDTFSRIDGGSLGYVKINYFGDSFEKAVSKLKPGEYSEPFESTLGFHIIRKEILTKKNILSILKDDYCSKLWIDTEKRIVNEARIEKK